jgi:hypothetical protein
LEDVAAIFGDSVEISTDVKVKWPVDYVEKGAHEIL